MNFYILKLIKSKILECFLLVGQLKISSTYSVVVRSSGSRSGPSPGPPGPGAAARPAAATGPGTAATTATAATS